MPTTGTIIVGAGQAGLALSRYLASAAHPHVLLERGRIGERWRSERWDSLTLLTPNWLNALPGSAAHATPQGFLSRDALVAYLESYAGSFAAPVVEGTTVLSIGRDGDGFRVETGGGTWAADNVVVATGDCDLPRLPPLAASVPTRITQLHSSAYRTPDGLPDGGVLVVGAGPTGQQLALELRRTGRAVVVAVGRHGRSLRHYRGRDIFEWLALIGDLDQTVDDVPDLQAAKQSPSLPLSGANGGEQIDLGVLHEAGVVIAGRLEGLSDRRALFAGDLARSLNDADSRMRRLLSRIDSHVSSDSTPDAEAVPAIELDESPSCVDLRRLGISTVIWATGYRRAYPWLHVPVVGADGEIVHRRGVTGVPGLYALGLRFQYRRNSHFVGGVGKDARFLATHILARELDAGHLLAA